MDGGAESYADTFGAAECVGRPTREVASYAKPYQCRLPSCGRKIIESKLHKSRLAMSVTVLRPRLHVVRVSSALSPCAPTAHRAPPARRLPRRRALEFTPTATMASLTDPLTLMREFVMAKKPITLEGDHVVFGRTRFARTQ